MNKRHCKIAVTGGIGCGKSFVCRQIEAAGYPIFYCDDEARLVLKNDEKVKSALQSLVGKELYSDQGELNKPVMRAFLLQGKAHAAQVDAIVHPRVAEIFLEWAERQTTEKVFMECAILFESGFDHFVDQVLYVSAPQEVRLARVMKRDQVTREKALQWMELQMSEAEKERRSDFTLINDGEADIETQLHEILGD